VALGGEDEAPFAPQPDSGANTPFTLLLFNLAATPEHENHGRFIATWQRRAPFAVLVDEAPLRRRLGAAGGAAERLQERRAAWQAFGTAHGLTLAFADLTETDTVLLASALKDMTTLRREACI
jgi:hypothetical protein